jgi:hypothetical protein
MAIKAIETVYNGYKFRSRLEARWAVFFDAMGVKYEYEPEGFDLGEAGWYLPDFRVREWNTWVEIKPEKPNTWHDGEPKIEYLKCQKLAELSRMPVMLIGGQPYIYQAELEDECRWKSDYQISVFLPDMVVHIPERSPNGVDFPIGFSIFESYGEKFFCSSARLYGFIYNEYKRDSSRFSQPMPERGDAKRLIDADKEYFLSEYGKTHPKWRYFITYDNLVFSCGIWGKLEIDRWYNHPDERCINNSILSAYAAARQARFEHKG